MTDTDALPEIILPEGTFDKAIYDPTTVVHHFVDYLCVRHPGIEWVGDPLREALALADHTACVDNGGHRYYPAHSADPERYRAFFEAAKVQANRIGMPEQAQLITEFFDWWVKHPVASDNDLNEAELAELKALDRRMYGLKFEDDALLAYLADLPEPQSTALRDKLFAPADAADQITAFEEHYAAMMSELGAEAAVAAAMPKVEALIAARRENLDSLQSSLEGLVRAWSKRGGTFETFPGELASFLQDRLMRPRRNDRNRYDIQTWVWLRNRPNVTLLPPKEIGAAIAKIQESLPKPVTPPEPAPAPVEPAKPRPTLWQRILGLLSGKSLG